MKMSDPINTKFTKWGKIMTKEELDALFAALRQKILDIKG